MRLEELPAKMFTELAALGKAMSDPTRLRILNVLCQNERSVDDLAERLGHSPANTSAHLKALQQAHLVARRKEGRHVYYAMAGPRAVRLFIALREMGLREIPAAREAMHLHAQEPALLPDLWGEELLRRVTAGEVVLVDLRPLDEYAAGHLPHARSVPAAELAERLSELPSDRDIVAYCRGPFCVAAITSVARMRDAGLPAYRLYGGVGDWVDAGLDLERPTRASTSPAVPTPEPPV